MSVIKLMLREFPCEIAIKPPSISPTAGRNTLMLVTVDPLNYQFVLVDGMLEYVIEIWREMRPTVSFARLNGSEFRMSRTRFIPIRLDEPIIYLNMSCTFLKLYSKLWEIGISKYCGTQWFPPTISSFVDAKFLREKDEQIVILWKFF